MERSVKNWFRRCTATARVSFASGESPSLAQDRSRIRPCRANADFAQDLPMHMNKSVQSSCDLCCMHDSSTDADLPSSTHMNKQVPALQAWRWGTSCVKLPLLHGNGRDTTQQNMCSYGDGKSLLAGRALLKRTRTAPSGAIAWLLLILFESRSVKKLVLQYYFKPQDCGYLYPQESTMQSACTSPSSNHLQNYGMPYETT